ncbi:MAG: hypothetical protein ABSA52_00635 [Candidatus Binatia bacterium]|jgi:hypothetical protein
MSTATTGNLSSAAFRFSTTAEDLGAYARVHLAGLHGAPPAALQVESTLRWHEGQPPGDRMAAFPHLAGLERVDRDLYVGPGELYWFRVDDLRDLLLHLSWSASRLTVEGDFYYRLANDRARDRAKRWLYPKRVAALRRRRFTTLLYYLVYYPCWWWLEQRQDFHPIHAAGVSLGSGVVLLGGASGVGKSTLAVALASVAGAKLLSDSFVVHNGSEVAAVREPILLDAWSRRWLGDHGQDLQRIEWRYCLNRQGYHLPPEHLAAGGRCSLLLFPRRAAQTYVRRIAAPQAHQRLSAADLIINDLRRYWAFAAVIEQVAPGGLVTRREAHLATLTAEVPCYELGLTEDMTCAASVELILQLLPSKPLRAVGAHA